MPPRRYHQFHVDQDERDGRWFVVSQDGYLAHVPISDTDPGLRAAFFDTREEADECARVMSATPL